MKRLFKTILTLFTISVPLFGVDPTPTPTPVPPSDGYNLVFVGTTGYGYFTVNGSITNKANGTCLIAFVATNSNYVCNGIVVNDKLTGGTSPWKIKVKTNTTISPSIALAPPQPYTINDGVMAIAIEADSNEWKQIIFASPTEITFVNDGKTYLYPSAISGLTIKAYDGSLQINTTTNSITTVRTKGETATVPVGPATLKDGESIVIASQITKLFIKGTGKANIIGISK